MKNVEDLECLNIKPEDNIQNSEKICNTSGEYVPPHKRKEHTSGAATQNSKTSNSQHNDNRPDIYSNNRFASIKTESHSRAHSLKKWVPSPRNEKMEKILFSNEGKQPSVGINFDSYADIPVKVSGHAVSNPIESFQSSNIHSLLLSNIELASYSTPTPVQKHAFSIISDGHDLMACAQTGSGKTAAFLLPILSNALNELEPVEYSKSARLFNAKESRGKDIAKPFSLILAPTRELASQIYVEATKFSYRSWIRPVVIYGGVDTYDQNRELRKGCNLLIATPGRLVDMIERGRVSLDNIKYLILDEADRMLDMGFEPQIRQIVEGSGMTAKEDRQTLMFSATFPKDIQILAADFLRDYIFLSVGKVGSTSENIIQVFQEVHDDTKPSSLMTTLNSIKKTQGLVLVFVETKKRADVLDKHLYERGFLSSSIHGDRTQGEREDALRSFRTGETPILVATAVAARGLDIPNVTHVINYDLPTDIDEYIHRIGRTGRAGNTGISISFFTEKNRGISNSLVDLLKESKQEIPPWLLNYSRPSSSSRGRGNRNSRRGNTRDYRTSPRKSHVPHQRYTSHQLKDSQVASCSDPDFLNISSEIDFRLQISEDKNAENGKGAEAWW